VGSAGNTASRDGKARARRRACRGFAAMENMIVRARRRESGKTPPGMQEAALRRTVSASRSPGNTWTCVAEPAGAASAAPGVGRTRLNIRPPPEGENNPTVAGSLYACVQRTNRLPPAARRKWAHYCRSLVPAFRRTVPVLSSVRYFRLFTTSNMLASAVRSDERCHFMQSAPTH
jgi:hypothetical protein